MSPEKQYLRWRQQPPVGCVFARIIARRPAAYAQQIVEITGKDSPTDVAAEIAARIGTLVSDHETQAAAILMPNVSSLEVLAKVALALDHESMWKVTTSHLVSTPAGDMVAFHIVREIPFGTTTCPSEALVLGPYPEFPPTRQAPITALEIYVGAPRPNDPKTGNPTSKANLAHMETHLPTERAFMKTWNNSVDGRAKSLGCDDNRAKAKVSFVIPAALATALGCAP